MIEFRKELQYLKCKGASSSSSSSSSSSASLSNNEEENNVQVKLVQSPSVPYREYDTRLGRAMNADKKANHNRHLPTGASWNIYISGTIPNVFMRPININLAATQNSGKTLSIPVHISIRVDEAVIVRNSFENNAWHENEERDLEGAFPFVQGTHFDMMISQSGGGGVDKDKPDKVLVAINGQFVFEYKHRLDPATIDSVEITGSVNLNSIRYEFL